MNEALNLCYFNIDMFNAVVCTVIHRTNKIIHFPTVLIAEATKAFALITASFGDLPLAKYAVVAAANVQPAPWL